GPLFFLGQGLRRYQELSHRLLLAWLGLHLCPNRGFCHVWYLLHQVRCRVAEIGFTAPGCCRVPRYALLRFCLTKLFRTDRSMATWNCSNRFLRRLGLHGGYRLCMLGWF